MTRLTLLTPLVATLALAQSAPPPAFVSGNRFIEEAASPMDLIGDAYEVQRYQISNLPGWGGTGGDALVKDALAK
jgi:hypothetical protein